MTIYKRYCNNCGKYYEGQGRYYCSVECKHESLRKRVRVRCAFCGKEVWVLPSRLKRYKHHFCNRKCYDNWNSKNLKGENNPFYGKKHTGETINLLREHHWSKTGVIEPPFKGKKHKSKTIEKIKKARAKQVISEESKEKIKKIRKEKWKDPKFRSRRLKELANGRKTIPNKIEKRLITINKKYNLPLRYVGDGSFFISTLNPDFIPTNGVKAVVEVFGDYWHGNTSKFTPRCWHQTEFGRIAYYAQFGYRTLILWEHELVGNKFGNKLSEKEIVDKIKKFTGD